MFGDGVRRQHFEKMPWIFWKVTLMMQRFLNCLQRVTFSLNGSLAAQIFPQLYQVVSPMLFKFFLGPKYFFGSGLDPDSIGSADSVLGSYKTNGPKKKKI
jgi:hypothetical protein